MSMVPTFATPPGFFGLAIGAGAATGAAGAGGAAAGDGGERITIAGVPFDLGTSNRPGARFGPQAIRHASRMLLDGDHPTHWVTPPAMPLADAGDFRIALGDLRESLRLIERQARGLGHLVALGGDHSITLPLLRALAARVGRLGVIHIDAHVDTWPDSFGQVYGHGSPFYHAITEHLIDPARMVQIGIRSPMQRHIRDWTLAQGVTIIPALAVHEAKTAAIAAQVRAICGGGPVYLSFDIDGLDPAFAPGTGTPETGGLATWQAQAILRGLKGLDFVGMDIVEVAPAYDVAEITALAAATMVWEYLALIAAGRADRAAGAAVPPPAAGRE